MTSPKLTSWHNSKRNQHTTKSEEHHKSKPQNDAGTKPHDNSCKPNSKCTKLCKPPWKRHNYQSSSQPPCTSARGPTVVGWQYFQGRWRKSRVGQWVWWKSRSGACVWGVQWWQLAGRRISSGGMRLVPCRRLIWRVVWSEWCRWSRRWWRCRGLSCRSCRGSRRWWRGPSSGSRTRGGRVHVFSRRFLWINLVGGSWQFVLVVRVGG